MRVSKHHGLRNDFLVVLDEVNDEPVDAGPDLARRLCDRRGGIGADGLIHGARPDGRPDVDVVMHLWNADGSRAEMSGKDLILNVGYSHPVNIPAPEGITFEVDTKTKQIKIKGRDKHQVGQIANDIRKIRPPEPYKGYGVRYLGEAVRRKAGKAGKMGK